MTGAGLRNSLLGVVILAGSRGRRLHGTKNIMATKLTKIEKVKKIMIHALDTFPPREDLAEDGFVCHEDIPDKTPPGFDAHFLICSEPEAPMFLICIQEIRP